MGRKARIKGSGVGRGRKTRFKPGYCKKAYEWYSNGLTLMQIAENFGVSLAGLFYWRRKYPRFEKCFKRALKARVKNVEDALFQRAVGMEIVDSTTNTVVNNNGTVTRTKTTVSMLPPDVKACQYILNNRDSKRWKNQRHVEANVSSVVGNVDTDKIKSMSTEELSAVFETLKGVRGSAT